MGPEKDRLAPENDAPKRTLGQKILTFFEVSFWGVAIASVLVMVYVNTSDDLEISPFLSPTLVLLFGCGIGFGMLFRTIARRKENISPINYFFKIGISVLVLLTVLLSFLLSLLKIL